ncbi:MAG TPA: SDR family oxidoreductase [Caldimonas sp.]|nr:SDR family oxidoreductase [Caldimonas sp.]
MSSLEGASAEGLHHSFLDFGGRWVVVTGASSGIGRAIAIELAHHGASLVLTGRDAARLDETRSLLNGAPSKTLRIDLAAHDALAPAMQSLVREIGPVYGLCHAAGVVETRPLSATTAPVVQALLDVNVLAGLELARIVCRRDVMTPDGGSILFISSVYGLVGMPGQVAYCASKGALASATRAMSIELARRRIRVNTLSPGLVETHMTESALGKLSSDQVEKLKSLHPLGIGQPVDVARAAVFLLAPATRWITGVDLPVDGGFVAQ